MKDRRRVRRLLAEGAVDLGAAYFEAAGEDGHLALQGWGDIGRRYDRG
jgi:hypothetical protein